MIIAQYAVLGALRSQVCHLQMHVFLVHCCNETRHALYFFATHNNEGYTLPYYRYTDRD